MIFFTSFPTSMTARTKSAHEPLRQGTAQVPLPDCLGAHARIVPEWHAECTAYDRALPDAKPEIGRGQRSAAIHPGELPSNFAPAPMRGTEHQPARETGAVGRTIFWRRDVSRAELLYYHPMIGMPGSPRDPAASSPARIERRESA